MRDRLRWLIALNWTAAGLALAMACEIYPSTLPATLKRLDQSDSRSDGRPEVKSPEESAAAADRRAAQVREGTAVLFYTGWAGWWALSALGCVNALGFIAAFRRLPPSDR